MTRLSWESYRIGRASFTSVLGLGRIGVGAFCWLRSFGTEVTPRYSTSAHFNFEVESTLAFVDSNFCYGVFELNRIKFPKASVPKQNLRHSTSTLFFLQMSQNKQRSKQKSLYRFGRVSADSVQPKNFHKSASVPR